MRDATTESAVWWKINKATTPRVFDTLYADMLARAKGVELYAQDFHGGAWPAPNGGSSLDDKVN